MKIKIAIIIMTFSIIVLSVAIYRLHVNKDIVAPEVVVPVVVKPTTVPIVRPSLSAPTPIVEPIGHHLLEVKQGHIIKGR